MSNFDPDYKKRQELETASDGIHRIPDGPPAPLPNEIYLQNDLNVFQNIATNLAIEATASSTMKSLDELLERDKQREKDGFPRKIRLGKLIRPGKGGKDKIVIVPTANEEKFYHDTREHDEENEKGDGEGQGGTGGTGEAEEGDVIGEQPIHSPDGKGQGGAGTGEGGDHEVGSDAYQLGKILTEKFQLPNLKDKGKKRSLTRYAFDLTDKNRGEGQIIDKKATLKQILKTNIGLGIVKGDEPIDPTKLLVNSRDRIYRVLSKERDYESQAVVFFVRDYSGSMYGAPTETVVAQHIMIYSWLMYQYQNQVESRFFVHDTDTKEVPDFYTYSNATVAGGTKIASALRLVNKIVEEESLARDYNIYVFYGGDGDDWDAEGKESIGELRTMLGYTNRLGVAIAKHNTYPTYMEKYIQSSGLLDEFPNELRLDAINPPADEERIVNSIKKLIS